MGNKLARLFEKYRRVIAFAVVGGVNTLVDYAVYSLLAFSGALSLGLCQAAGYVSGVVCSFILNRGITFKKGATGSLFAQIVKFLLVNGVTLAVSIFAIRALVEGAGMNKYLAKLPVTAIVMIINYFGYKILVFGIKEKNGGQMDDGQGTHREGH